MASFKKTCCVLVVFANELASDVHVTLGHYIVFQAPSSLHVPAF